MWSSLGRVLDGLKGLIHSVSSVLYMGRGNSTVTDVDAMIYLILSLVLLSSGGHPGL